MEIKVQIPFQQLLDAVKALPDRDKARLQQELNGSVPGVAKTKSDYLEMLLNGPVYSEKEIKTIEENHKSIAQWRKKS